MAVFVVGAALVLTLGAYFRHEPPGLANPYRQGAAHATHLFWARAAVLALYPLALAPATVVARAAARRAGAPARRVGVAVLAAVGLFMLLMLPLVEFLTACYVGQGIVLRPSC